MAVDVDVEKSINLNRAEVSSGPRGSTSESILVVASQGKLKEAISKAGESKPADDTLFEAKGGGGSPPDGGLVAWLQLVAALLTSTVSWGTPTAFGIFQLYYVETLELPQSKASWIGSVRFFLTYGMCVVSGRLSDAGYIRSTFIVFGTFVTSLGYQYWHFFLAQGLAVGLGLGIMFMPPLQVLSSYFEKRLTLAMTGAATGTGIGSLVLPAIIQYSIPQVGFAWAVRIFGFVALFCTAIAFFCLRPRLTPRRSGALAEWSSFRERLYTCRSRGELGLGKH